jgi:hypothetical protein
MLAFFESDAGKYTIGRTSRGAVSACLLRKRIPRGANVRMTESEINALLDAHDALVKAYIDSSLAFSEFVSAYGDFPHNYRLLGHSETAEEFAVSRLFRKRIAFHLRVSALVSGLRSADDPVDISDDDAGRFLPAVLLMRVRQLVARYPELQAESDSGALDVSR